jgi:hypothetical protein
VNFRVFEKGADAIFRNAIEIEMLNVPEATFRNLKNYQAVRNVISIVEQKIDEVQKQSKNQKILVVVPSQIENEVREALGERDNISIIHYWGSETKGVNKFEDYDVVILVALPIPNVYQIRERNKFLKKLAEEKGVELIEDIAVDVKEHLWQIINRLRPFRKDYKKVKVYVIGKFEGKNNQIGASVKKFLLSFQEQESKENKGDIRLYELGRAIYKKHKGLIPRLFIFEDDEPAKKITVKEIGECSSEQKTFLIALKCRFPYLSLFVSEDGKIYSISPKHNNIRDYYKAIKEIQRAENLDGDIKFKFMFLRIQKKGRRNIEMDIAKEEMWGVVGDLDEFRKRLYEKTGILIYAVNKEGEEIRFQDSWTKEKQKELERIKEGFNRLTKEEEGEKKQGEKEQATGTYLSYILEQQGENKPNLADILTIRNPTERKIIGQLLREMIEEAEKVIRFNEGIKSLLLKTDTS